MRTLRHLTNALVSGLYFATLLAILVVDLNINSSASPFRLIGLSLFLMFSYGLLAALLCFLVASAYRFLTGKKTPTRWISPSYVSLSLSLMTLLALVIFRENYVYFLSYFVPPAQILLRAQMIVLFILAVAGLVLRYQHLHRRPRPFTWPLFGLIVAASLLLCAGLRSIYPHLATSFRLATLTPKTVTKKVTVLRFEGLDLNTILALTNEHKLPNFQWLMERGAWGRLAGFTPSDSAVLSASFDTGKFPGQHRRISDVRYRIPLLSRPLEVVPRFILFRQLKRLGLLKIEPNVGGPSVKSLETIFEDCGVPVRRQDSPADVPEPGKTNPKTEKLFATLYPNAQAETSWIFSQVKQAFFRDADAEDRASAARTGTPQLFLLGLDGLTMAQMYFTKYSEPAAFGDIRQDDIQKYGAVIEKYYQFYDGIIGTYLASLKDDELFLVYSPFGSEPLPFWKRVVEWILGNAAVSAYHEQAPPGAVFFYGPGVARGKNIDGLRIVDLAPTILYYVGLPVGKDMDGYVRGSLFEPDFTSENPLSTITTYEDVAINKATEAVADRRISE